METLKNSNRAKNPQKDANIFSKFLFWYLNDTFSTGYKRPLEKTDILKINEEHSTEPLCNQMEKIWESELKKKERNGGKPSYFRCLFRMRCFDIFIVGICQFFIEVMRISQSIMLRQLLDAISSKDFLANNEAYYWATGISVALLLQWIVLHQTFFKAEKLGVDMKSASTAMIYKKALRLSNGSLGTISTGHIVTLVSTDVHKIQEGFKLANYLWISPVQLISVVVILYMQLGPSSLAGVGTLLLVIPIQSWFGKLFANMRLQTVLKTDKRINVMNEVITSMQVTKMYAWEDSFSTVINQIRRAESKYVMKSAMLRSVNTSMFSISPYLISLATFSLFYFYGDGLSLSLVFLTMSLFFAIRLGVVTFFPVAIQLIMECYVSCKRVTIFLLHDELHTTGYQHLTDTTKHAERSVSFKNVTATWGLDSEEAVVDKLSFKADQKNSLVMIVGPVGAGKTSILMSIMNELHIKSGNVVVNGTIGYAAQQAWIFSGTVRQNILFGKDFSKHHYEKVIFACALKPDLESFEKGDLTLVGERGVSLSGGQKARISLARAVYRGADIYLLDDPLSAVDTKVGKHIFERCIKGLLKDKIVILVTHQIQYVEHATDIICLKEDATTVEGSLHELSQLGIDLVAIIHPEPQEKRWDHDSAIETEDNMHYLHPEDVKLHALSGISLDNLNEKRSHSSTRGSYCKVTESFESLNNIHIPDEEESVARGAVPFKIYVKYLLHGGGCLSVFVLLFSLVFGQCVLTITDYWLAEWAEGEQQRLGNLSITSKYYIKDDPDINLYIFAALAIAAIILNLFRTVFFYTSLVRCSRNLHNSMFKAILKAPIYFFNTNPVGQILNRFSRDIYFLDDELPWVSFDFVQFTLLTLAIVVMNCVSVPYLTILVVPLLIIFLYARQYYMSSSREIKRLEAISRSPLFTHISATLAGMTTIRSFNVQKKIMEEFYACQDYQTEAWIMFLSCSRWFSQRLDLLALTFSICAMYAPVVAARHIDVDPGMVGVSLTYILSMCGMFQWCVRQSAEVDNLMTSVERVFEYADIEAEPDNGNNKDLRDTWPEYGLITAEGASFAYHSTLPYVLKKLYFCVRPMEKVGIVGRTGAGKSSLLSMLFRLGDVTGKVMIDGILISDLKLKHLRKSISVIPQDPVMFSGSLRINLDPFQEHSDADIWEALEEVQMKETVMELPKKLQTEIAESGSNCSVGERQLLCLARALLKKNKILVIDEATANVDLETDSLIQQTIREKFKECTVLTVAHRLNTVMDSDRVMVMDNGKVVEFDEPYELLQNRCGVFRKLVDQAGRNEASRLEVLAEEAKQLRHVMFLQQEVAYPGSQITFSKSKEEIIDHFGTRVIYETTL